MHYEYYCPKCDHICSFIMTLREYNLFKPDPCKQCDVKLKRYFSTPPMLGATGTPKFHEKQLHRPINIIDENPDGSYKVTRVGQKRDIEND